MDKLCPISTVVPPCIGAAQKPLALLFPSQTCLMQSCIPVELSYTRMYLGQGFAEIIHHKDTVKVYSGNLDAAGIECLGTRYHHPSQVCPAPHIAGAD